MAIASKTDFMVQSPFLKALCNGASEYILPVGQRSTLTADACEEQIATVRQRKPSNTRSFFIQWAPLEDRVTNSNRGLQMSSFESVPEPVDDRGWTQDATRPINRYIVIDFIDSSSLAPKTFSNCLQ
jgi:hypothetical protein